MGESWFGGEFCILSAFNRFIDPSESEEDYLDHNDNKRILRLALVLSMDKKMIERIEGIELLKTQKLFWNMKSVIEKGSENKICDTYEEYILSDYRTFYPGEQEELIEEIKTANGEKFAESFSRYMPDGRSIRER